CYAWLRDDMVSPNEAGIILRVNLSPALPYLNGQRPTLGSIKARGPVLTWQARREHGRTWITPCKVGSRSKRKGWQGNRHLPHLVRVHIREHGRADRECKGERDKGGEIPPKILRCPC